MIVDYRGKRLEFPDGMSTEEMQAAIEQMEAASASTAEPGTDWFRVGAQTLGGAIGGALGVAGSTPTGFTSAPVLGPLAGAVGSQFAGLLYDTATGAPVQSPMQLGTNIGVEALAGAAIPQAGGYLMDKAIKPLANAAYQRGIAPAIGKVQEAGLALMDRVGGRSDTVQQAGNALKARFPDINFLPGQQSGSVARLSRENYLRQNPGSADIMAEIDAQNARALAGHVSQMAERTGGNRLTETQLGGRLQGATENAAQNIEQFAKGSWRALTDPLTQAGVMVRPSQTVNALDQMIAELSAVPTPKNQAAAAELEAIRSRMIRPPTPATVDQFGNIIPANPGGIIDMPFDAWQAMKSQYGKASKGADNIFQNIQEAGDLSRRTAARLAAALESDMQGTASTVPPHLQPFYGAAQDIYRKSMGSLERMDASLLGRQMGDTLNDTAYGTGAARSKSGSAATRAMLSPRADLGEVSYTTQMLRDSDPQALADLQRFAIEDALRAAGQVPPSGGITQPPISMAKLVRGMPEAERLQALGVDPTVSSDIRAALDAAVRLGDRTGFNFSNTNTARETADLMSIGTPGGALAAPGKIIDYLTRGIGAKEAAMNLADPVMRAQIQQAMAQRAARAALLRPPPTPTPLKGAAAGAARSLTGSYLNSERENWKAYLMGER